MSTMEPECTCVDTSTINEKIEKLPSEESISSMSSMFNALQCATRLKILFLLLQGGMCVKGIEAALGIPRPSISRPSISQSAISHSLKNLRQNNLVRVEKEGRFAVYYLADEHVEMFMSMCRDHVEE